MTTTSPEALRRRRQTRQRSTYARLDCFDVWCEVPLVPQLTGMSCWAAAAAMIVGYRECLDVKAHEVAHGAGVWEAYKEGLVPEDVVAIARAFRLQIEPPRTYSPAALRALIEQYGPLWVGEASPGLHVVVVTGMFGDGSLDGTFVRIADPWPIGRGERYVLSFREFAQNLEAAAEVVGATAQILHGDGRRQGATRSARSSRSSSSHTIRSDTMATYVIDCGHGGNALASRSTPHGVRGPTGLTEKEVTLDIGTRVARYLGREAVLTRSDDRNLSLAERAEIARRMGAEVFISLHTNEGDPRERGPETWVHSRAGTRSRSLARSIQGQLANLGGPDRGTRAGDMAVLSPDRLGARSAACLVEIDYLSNPNVEAQLRDPRHRDAIARAIARGAFAVSAGTTEQTVSFHTREHTKDFSLKSGEQVTLEHSLDWASDVETKSAEHYTLQLQVQTKPGVFKNVDKPRRHAIGVHTSDNWKVEANGTYRIEVTLVKNVNMTLDPPPKVRAILKLTTPDSTKKKPSKKPAKPKGPVFADSGSEDRADAGGAEQALYDGDDTTGNDGGYTDEGYADAGTTDDEDGVYAAADEEGFGDAGASEYAEADTGGYGEDEAEQGYGHPHRRFGAKTVRRLAFRSQSPRLRLTVRAGDELTVCTTAFWAQDRGSVTTYSGEAVLDGGTFESPRDLQIGPHTIDRENGVLNMDTWSITRTGTYWLTFHLPELQTPDHRVHVDVEILVNGVSLDLDKLAAAETGEHDKDILAEGDAQQEPYGRRAARRASATAPSGFAEPHGASERYGRPEPKRAAPRMQPRVRALEDTASSVPTSQLEAAVQHAHDLWQQGISEARDVTKVDAIVKDSGFAYKVQSWDWCGMFVAACLYSAGLDADLRRGFYHVRNVENFFRYRAEDRVKLWILTDAGWEDLATYHAARGSSRQWISRSDVAACTASDVGDLDIRPGDVALIDHDADGTADHIVLVEAFEEGVLYTIEGNAKGDLCTGVNQDGIFTTTTAKEAVVKKSRDLKLATKRATLYGVGRLSVVDFEDHRYEAQKPTAATK